MSVLANCLTQRCLIFGLISKIFRAKQGPSVSYCRKVTMRLFSQPGLRQIGRQRLLLCVSQRFAYQLPLKKHEPIGGPRVTSDTKPLLTRSMKFANFLLFSTILFTVFMPIDMKKEASIFLPRLMLYAQVPHSIGFKSLPCEMYVSQIKTVFRYTPWRRFG